jgi:hypothetical protein
MFKINKMWFKILFLEYMRKGLPYPPSGYEELDATQLHPSHDHY